MTAAPRACSNIAAHLSASVCRGVRRRTQHSPTTEAFAAVLARVHYLMSTGSALAIAFRAPVRRRTVIGAFGRGLLFFSEKQTTQES